MDQGLRQSICEHRGCRDKCKCLPVLHRRLVSELLSRFEPLLRSSTLVGFDSLAETEGI